MKKLDCRRAGASFAELAGDPASGVGRCVLAFWYSPTDASTLGFSQKIFYFHAPIAETALLAFGVAFVAAVLYLRTRGPEVGPPRRRRACASACCSACSS